MRSRRSVPIRAPRVVLGLSALAHDPAACLFVDGVLIAAIEEERLAREKNVVGFPHRAIDFVLRQAGLTHGDVDCVANYWDDCGQFWRGVVVSLGFLRRRPLGALQSVVRNLTALSGPRQFRSALAKSWQGRPLPVVRHVPHHVAHALHASASAEFDADAALVIDGRGEHAATTLFRVDWSPAGAPTVDEVESIAFPDSLGAFYGGVTQQLGYEPLSDEYRVMGLAALGSASDDWSARLRELLSVSDDGTYRLNLRHVNVSECAAARGQWFSAAGRELLAGSFRRADDFTADGTTLARAAQDRLEEAVVGLGKRLARITKGRRAVVAGGVALNGKALNALRRCGAFESLATPFAPNDSGACLGAALAVLTSYGVRVDRRSLRNPFQGPGEDATSIEPLLIASGYACHRPADVPAAAARQLAAGRVVAWFEGRSEFGPRALGGRSILADPRDVRSRDRVNSSIKHRESYRPLAPSILEERAPEYFDCSCSRYMGEVVAATTLARERVPAVVHGDGTARPQTVPADWPHAGFRGVLEAFEALTGTPVVLNTSFNVKGEPMVATAKSALECFHASGIDVLCIGPFVVERRAAP